MANVETKVDALIREWWKPLFHLPPITDGLRERIISLVEEQVREEREECARLVEAKRIGAWLNEVADYDILPEIARAIRSRGEGR